MTLTQQTLLNEILIVATLTTGGTSWHLSSAGVQLQRAQEQPIPYESGPTLNSQQMVRQLVHMCSLNIT